MINGRLFVFGCSFSNHIWPTYADLISPNFKQYYNLGSGGAANQVIHHRLTQAASAYHITHGDYVILQWAGVEREGRLIDGTLPHDLFGNTIDDVYGGYGNWYGTGFIGNRYSKEFMERYSSWRGIVMSSLSLFASGEALLKCTGATYHIFGSQDYEVIKNNYKQYEDTVTLYRDVFSTWLPRPLSIITMSPQVEIIKSDGTSYKDLHPTPNDYVKYVSTVLPRYPVPEHMLEHAHQITTDITRAPIKEQLYGSRGKREIIDKRIY